MITAIYGGSKDIANGFRIKLWNKDTNVIVYDNKLRESDDTSTELGGGSIVIHTVKNK